jgi:hypothetical protein
MPAESRNNLVRKDGRYEVMAQQTVTQLWNTPRKATLTNGSTAGNDVFHAIRADSYVMQQ